MAEVGQVHALRSVRSFDDSSYASLSYLLVLSPLVYSMDNDPYRAWEVGFVGIIIMWVAASISFRAQWTGETMTLAAYAVVLVLQQFFIPNGSLWFGAKYAVSMATVFIPSWVVFSLDWKLSDFSMIWDRAIRILGAIVVLNYGASYTLGIGEILPNSSLWPRVFGYLGDSFTPVLVFLFLYFLFQRNYGWSVAMLSALALTQGKAALITLLFAIGLYGFLKSKGTTRILVTFAVSVLILAVGVSAVRTALSSSVVEISLVTRLISFERGLQLAEQYPVLGVGINQSMKGAIESGQALARLANLTSFDRGNSQIDNAFLRAMAETGIFGLAVLITLCLVLIRRALSSIRAVWRAPPSKVRALALASGIWVVAFIATYQFVGWFEAGHPQMTWLLLISSGGFIASQTYARAAMPAQARLAAGGEQQ